MTTPRFSFPGFTSTASFDDARAEIEKGNLTIDGVMYSVDMVRPHTAPSGATFLCSSIYRGEDLIWNFKIMNFVGYSHLAMADTTPVIALVNKSKAVVRVIPLSDMILPGSIHASRGMRALLSLKKAAAKTLNFNCELSSVEEKLARADVEKQQKEANEAAENARLEKLQRRMERREAILSRPVINVVTFDGTPRRGVPVTKDEWVVLDAETFVVLVDQISKEGKIGTPIESFCVGRNPGKNAFRMHAKVVKTPNSSGDGLQGTSALPTPVDQGLFELDGDFFELNIYSSIEDVRKLRASSHSGVRAAIPASNKAGVFQILELFQDKMTTLCETTSVQLAA